MIRAKAIIAQVLLISFGVVIGGTVLFVLRGGISYLPQLDGMIFPVVKIGKPSDFYRDEAKACFSLPEEKLSGAAPLKYEFWAQTTYSPTIGLSAYLANPDNTRRANPILLNHGAGKKWTTRYCFEMPGTIADAQDITITGHAMHRRHWGWETETPVPSFTIPAL